MSDRTLDRIALIERMYQGYLDAHDLLVAGEPPSEIPPLAEFSQRLGEETVSRFPSLKLELRGREAIERFMVEARQSMGLRETSERVFEHGNVVVSLNRTPMTGRVAAVPVVAMFLFDGDRLAEFWGFASIDDTRE